MFVQREQKAWQQASGHGEWRNAEWQASGHGDWRNAEWQTLLGAVSPVEREIVMIMKSSQSGT
jgi:hypothetical protein